MSPAAVALALGRASLEAAALVAAVVAFARLAPRIPAGARCALWWLASLRALTGCLGLPAWGVPMAALAPTGAPAMAARAGGAIRAALPASLPVVAAHAGSAVPPAAPPIDAWGIACSVLAAIWLAGAMGMAVRHLLAARRLDALWRDAEPLDSPSARACLAEWLGGPVGERVELRTSDAVRSPLVLGVGRPRILLPDSCRELSAGRARMALAHEAGHLRRGDVWWSWVPALAECVFWFHPLVRLGVREYVQAREEACDAQALRWTAAEPERYGDMLVRFGVDPSRLGQAVSCGSPHVRHLERRLHMLAHTTIPGRAQRAVAVAALVVFGSVALIPVRLVAAHSGDADASRSTPNSRSVTTTSTNTRSASGSSAGATSTSSGHSRVATSGEDPDSYQAYGTYTTGKDGLDLSFGLMTGGTQSFSDSISGDDGEVMEKVRARERGRFLWFRLGAKNYVVRDPQALDQVREIMRPQDELGRRQGALGDQQSRLGEKQGDLGERQGKFGEEQSRISERVSDLETKLAEGDLTRAERAALDREIDDLRARVDAISDAQSQLGDLQSQLGAQQSELGRKQSEMGRLQSEASVKIQRDMRDLAGRLVRDGRAKPIED